MPIELWRPIAEFPDYQVSNLGRVKSRYRGKKSGGILRPGDSHGLSMIVALCKDGICHTKRVARLVLESFIGKRPNGMECCHNDGNHKNDRLDNLRWDTHKSNIHDRIRHGTDNRGERSGLAKLTAQQVREIRAKYIPRKYTIDMLAKQFGVSCSAIQLIVTNQRWKYMPEVNSAHSHV